MARTHPALLVLVTLQVAVGSACDRAEAWSWPEAAPAAHGLDKALLEALAARIQAEEGVRDLHSLLIARNGHLVFERYFEGYDAGRRHMLQSVSKSVTSALIGIAIGRGEIQGVDERVLGFFESTDGIENLDDRKRAMRLEDLLTMRSGTDYHERGAGSPHSKLNALPRGWDRFVLSRPMTHDPGTRFQYDSGAVILMSSLLKARTGHHADSYAERHLFGPLGIERTKWYRNEEGHPHTGGGLDLRPRDMARFGQLYLQGGRWDGRQVVPESWVRTSTSQHVEFANARGGAVGYGYLWWILPPSPAGAGHEPIYGAFGFRAQYIFVIPEHQMVVVFTGGTRSWQDERRPRELLYSDILPAVKR